MTNTFPKDSRLLKRREFERVARQGRKGSGKSIYIDILKNQSFGPKLGITVTRKNGDAVQRNRFKRLVREAFRVIRKKLPPDIHIVVRPKMPLSQITLNDIAKDLAWILIP